VIWILLLAACAPNPDDLACRTGFERAPDGHCYPLVDPQPEQGFQDLFDLLEPCTGLRPSSRIDFGSGCADELCPGDLYEVAIVVMGPPVECFASGGDAYCRWRSGVEGRWDDENANLIPDPGSRNQRVHVQEPFVSGNELGLGLRMPPSCYTDALGPPDETIVVDTELGLFIQKLDFVAEGVLVYDLEDADGRAGADGLIDQMYLYGAP
jgi:hypothetical protein